MTTVKSAREVAVEFMLGQGRHFCENSYCTCIDRLAEVIQWERSLGAVVERERLAAEKDEPSKTRPLAKTRRSDRVPTAVDLRHADVRKAPTMASGVVRRAAST